MAVSNDTYDHALPFRAVAFLSLVPLPLRSPDEMDAMDLLVACEFIQRISATRQNRPSVLPFIRINLQSTIEGGGEESADRFARRGFE